MPTNIPAGTGLVYSAALSTQTFTGDGVIWVSSASGNTTATFAAAALQGLTGTDPAGSVTNAAVPGTAGKSGLHVGNGSRSAFATVRDFPAKLTYYVNSYISYTDTHTTIASDAVGGTYPTTIDIIRWNTANAYTAKLIANQGNTNGAITLTGGMQQVYSTSSVTITLSGTNTQANALAGSIVNGTGPVALIKEGVGKWVLSGDNSFTGGISVTGGTLGVRHSNGLGLAGSGAISVGNGCTLEVGGGVSVTKTAGITVQGTGVGGVGGIRCTDGDNSFVGAVTLAANTTVQVDAGATLTFAGNINYNGFTLTQAGAGKIYIPTATAATGTYAINAGTVQIGYGESKALPGNVSLGATGQLAAQDGGSHYRAVVAGTLTMAAGAQLTFGPPV